LKRPSGNGPLFAYLKHNSKVHHMGRKKDGGDILVGGLWMTETCSTQSTHTEHTVETHTQRTQSTHRGDAEHTHKEQVSLV
jgi:hypothetical protein